jgi:carbonic anhydrase
MEVIREGNLRFIEPDGGREATERSLLSFSDLSAGQHPFAAVVACSDSRVPVEAIFSQVAGSLFVVRVAGNVMGPHQLGSLEFAVAELGVPLILVMGHTGCGAVNAALASMAGGSALGLDLDGHLPALVEPIVKALGRTTGSELGDGTLDPEDAVRLNVLGQCEELIHQSRLVASKVESGDLLVAGSVYDLRTGRVDFLPDGQDPVST